MNTRLVFGEKTIMGKKFKLKSIACGDAKGVNFVAMMYLARNIMLKLPLA